MLYGVITKLFTPTTGQITEDVTSEIYTFDDLDLPTKGLGMNSPVSFDQDPNSARLVAINIQAYQPAEIIITSATSGPITIENGETLIVRTAKGIVTGDITINSGKLIVGSNAQVIGNVSATDGNVIARNGGVIKGNIHINQGGALKVGGKTGGVKGNIVINQGGRMIMGDDGGGGVIEGTIVSDRGRFTLRADSVISAGNSGGDVSPSPVSGSGTTSI